MDAQNRRCTFIVLIGIPASGKSTFAAKLQAYYSFRSPESVVLHVPYDELVPEIQPSAWKKQRDDVVAAVLQICSQESSSNTFSAKILAFNHLENPSSERNSVAKEYVFILDDNFYYRSMRYDVYRKLASLADFLFIEVYIPVPLETAVTRNEKRTKPVPIEVVARMHSLLESPDPERYPFERISIEIAAPCEESSLQRVFDYVAQAWLEPRTAPNPLEMEKLAALRMEAQAETKRSVLHRIDCILRALVQEKCLSAIQNGASAEKAVETGIFNKARKSVLDIFRSFDLQYYDVNPSVLQCDVCSHFEDQVDRARLKNTDVCVQTCGVIRDFVKTYQ